MTFLALVVKAGRSLPFFAEITNKNFQKNKSSTLTSLANYHREVMMAHHNEKKNMRKNIYDMNMSGEK